MAPTIHQHEPPLLLTVNEVCDQLHLSRPSVYALINSGELRSLAFGRARRVPRQAVEEFIRARLESGSDSVA